ncbi:hypothetical protein NX059_010605 [Plenodomus lindquistii]|nr:hypothetical protein NX059_010605 [Plenodomus lindquistii]
MNSKAPTNPIFDTLGLHMPLFTPQEHSTSKLIILFTWPGANRKNIKNAYTPPIPSHYPLESSSANHQSR